MKSCMGVCPGRRSWESLFLGAETPQRLATCAVNASGDLQCPACQGTSFGWQCGQSLTSSPSCWRLPDGNPSCRNLLCRGGSPQYTDPPILISTYFTCFAVLRTRYISHNFECTLRGTCPTRSQQDCLCACADKGRYSWLSGKAMEQLKGLQEWQQPASCTQCEPL